MREIRFKIHTSVDGFIGKPDGDVEWIFGTMSDDMRGWELDLIQDASLHMMGRVLYEDMVAHWPDSDDQFAAPMNDIPKLVLSSTVNESDWKGTSFASGDVTEIVSSLKRDEGKPVLLHGGAGVARDLARNDLIDEWVLIQHPVAIGEGLPIFDSPKDLRLTGQREFEAGAVALTYRRA